jgi:hypothetical protein
MKTLTAEDPIGTNYIPLLKAVFTNAKCVKEAELRNSNFK